MAFLRYLDAQLPVLLHALAGDVSLLDCLYWVRSRCALCPICISLTSRGRASPCSPTPVAGLFAPAALPPAEPCCDGCCRALAAPGPPAVDRGLIAADADPTAAEGITTAADAGTTAAEAGPTAAAPGVTAAGAATTGGSWHGSPAMMMNL